MAYFLYLYRGLIMIFFSKYKSKGIKIMEDTQRKQLKNILHVAKEIISETKGYEEIHPIYLLIKQLINKELYNNMYNLISTLDDQDVKTFTTQDLLPNDRGYSNDKQGYLYTMDNKQLTRQEFINQCRIGNVSTTIKLGYHPILPQPWRISRLTGALTTICSRNPKISWKQDNNHEVELWLPFGVTFVWGGNHSIATGVLNNEGELKVDNIYDMSSIFPYIYCDGVNYFRTEDDSLYAPVSNLALAAIFEIGRLIANENASGRPIKFNSLFSVENNKK